MLARQIERPVREIVYRTRGLTHGPITRLVSPSDLGKLIKPFVFLDLFDFDGRTPPAPMEFGWHPHSGIATVTVMFDGSVRYAETTGNASHYVMPEGVPVEDPVRVILGPYRKAQSPIAAPPMSYLAVSLKIASVGPTSLLEGTRWAGSPCSTGRSGRPRHFQRGDRDLRALRRVDRLRRRTKHEVRARFGGQASA
jgi:hypothetical protein